jgi:hypothetical protein
MRTPTSLFTLGAAAALFASPAFGQGATAQQLASREPAPATADSGARGTTTDSSKRAAAPSSVISVVKQIQVQGVRPNDQRGINVFESPKSSNLPYEGFKFDFGAAFTQQFQGLGHSNTAQPVTRTDAAGNEYNANQLIRMGHGFNNAVANAYVDAQLAKGIRVSMTGYLSARHHQETWIKDGYLLVDDSPIQFAPLTTLMQYVTVKAGHFEVNYGDAHFRRTDNGNAMFNPLVGNYLMDAFTTSVGGEVYLRGRGNADGLFAMGGMTNGEVRGTVLNPQKRSPAFIGKIGGDRQLTPDLRVRLTGSLLSQARSANQTLYTGDRAGSRYYDVLENVTSTEKDQAWSGSINPGISSEMHAAVVNPFVKFRGLELFGNFERARGRSAVEIDGAAPVRQWNQNVYEGTYRFLRNRLYVSGRYNTAEGRLAGLTEDVSVNRTQVGGGWFINPMILVKAEYVTQKYNDFPATDIRNGGKFDGFMVEGAVAF